MNGTPESDKLSWMGRQACSLHFLGKSLSCVGDQRGGYVLMSCVYVLMNGVYVLMSGVYVLMNGVYVLMSCVNASF